MHPTAIDDLFLIRCSAPSELVHGLHKPALCIIVQGSKEVRLGDELYTYDALHYTVVSVTVPVAGRVLEASSGEPYLCIRTDIDPAMVATTVAESAPLSQPVEGAARGVYLDRIDAPLLDATLRLVRLLASPQDIPVLAPLAMREIFYRLLCGRRGATCTRSRCATARPSRHPRDRMAEPQLRRAAAHRGTGAAGQPQQLDAASPFQGAHLDEPAAVPEAAAPAGGAAAADRRGARCVQRRLPVGYESPRSSAASTAGCSAPRR